MNVKLLSSSSQSQNHRLTYSKRFCTILVKLLSFTKCKTIVERNNQLLVWVVVYIHGVKTLGERNQLWRDFGKWKKLENRVIMELNNHAEPWQHSNGHDVLSCGDINFITDNYNSPVQRCKSPCWDHYPTTFVVGRAMTLMTASLFYDGSSNK